MKLTYSQASRLSRAVDPLEKVRNEIIDDMAEEAPELTDALIAIGNRIGDIVDEISELINR